MPLLPEADQHRITRWYFGGIAATIAHVFIYPLDVLKVGLQTEQIMEKITTARYARYIWETQGLLAFYSGLAAALRQQFTHSIVRFGVYYKLKETLQMKEVPLIVDLFLTAGSGACGAILKNPIDIIATRMKIDLKRPRYFRYNYRSLSHALDYILMTEGYRALFLGVELNLMKSIAFTCSQICVYEHFKKYLKRQYKYKDQTRTHVIASALAGIFATLICQPIEVVKVRYMTRSHEYANVWEVFRRQKHMGMLGFYRGILLSFIKIEIQTITTFVFIEKMRLHYGLMPQVCANELEARFKDCIVVKKPKVVPPPGYFDRFRWITQYIPAIPLVKNFSSLFSYFRRPPPPEPEPPVVEKKIETTWMKAKKRLKRRIRCRDKEEEDVDEDVKEQPTKRAVGKTKRVYDELKSDEENDEMKDEGKDVEEPVEIIEEELPDLEELDEEELKSFEEKHES
ncbi:mitochondrial dicarboxylate carrier-related [Holotrichia oblita]|uniref:Mitochondrial dicarboxylate carrier-related n=1 Tax=Holotrichia oblita TaxID=644536 RepID=A0ACB9SPE4_HOLOL|nr:mitochondrial dicarboxylate carrier-related [Holotrichia oblita]